jgi:RNA polymerase sigma factor (sigma-70 family)
MPLTFPAPRAHILPEKSKSCALELGAVDRVEEAYCLNHTIAALPAALVFRVQQWASSRGRNLEERMTREGYGEAYQRGFNLTVRFLVSRGAWRDHASEIAQAAWARGWERLDQLRNEALVLTWVNTIALNLHRGLLRREPLNQVLLEVSDSTEGVNLAAIDVAQVFRLCRPQERDLLEQYMSGATTAEIAERYGVSATAVRIRLLRTRRHLRDRVQTTTAPLTHSQFQLPASQAA